MRKTILNLSFLIFATAALAQSGHIMQGVGAVNMSMGGAATAQPLDISGALQWNPAAISTFDDKILKFDIGLFFSSPELSSSLPAGMLGPGAPGVSGTTADDRPLSPMPALAMVWGKEGSKHTFGASAFGISGFGVTFPEEANNPLSGSFNPMEDSNPINYPQAAMGFGHIESDYLLLQVGLSYAYELSDKFSIGIQPNIDYAALELAPNPTASPTMAGYPTTDKASAIGFGAQFGLFYDSGLGLKLGASYKTAQKFGEFEFENTYLDNSTEKNNFQMDYPAIFSLGFGYSTGDVDLALDFRRVDYENTEGFSETGWTQTASVAGFGWKNISILSAGLQYKGINKLPLRFGYTYSSNPIPEEIAFFNIPATAIIKNAYQFGLSYVINDNWKLDAVYHYGDSNGATEGNILNPMMASPSNPLGAIPGSSVSYDMTTSMVQLGIGYTFTK
ncbi:OmpP1/FadL family transporter [Maribacter arenosus]|uniref:Outer membrane protein transport protein n=1 Tax=Maribacter arenosus TaxID=1854708 RepID=A0ABR7VDN5_9FLAO|nr:outer membrane protein transport protein [Maribacter arenosus]MBD0851749.1 outer membrane protein transport protein [Maribacter arenosus]